MVTPWREGPSGIGKKDETQSQGKDRFNSVLKSCQNTLATFARSSQLSQQSVTSHSNQTLSGKHVLPQVLIQNAGTLNVSLASGNQDAGKIQNSWNDNGGDNFEDWEEYFAAEMQMQSSDVGGAAGNAPQEQKESAFFNNLPEGIQNNYYSSSIVNYKSPTMTYNGYVTAPCSCSLLLDCSTLGLAALATLIDIRSHSYADEFDSLFTDVANTSFGF